MSLIKEKENMLMFLKIALCYFFLCKKMFFMWNSFILYYKIILKEGVFVEIFGRIFEVFKISKKLFYGDS